MEDVFSLIQQQITYYRERASEYDEWFLRQGRYDHGVELNREWFREVEQVRDALNQFQPSGKVLEFACGTGLWTQQLLKYAQQITAVDAVAEVLELNRARAHNSKVKYIQADIFTWEPEEQYDVIFFSFWLSHVPAECFEPFWQMLRRGLQSDGRIFFVDSRYEPASTARDQNLGDKQVGRVNRRLNDGREYQIVKIFYECTQLEQRLGQLGWDIKIKETPHYFLWGHGASIN
jgi:2-polyprenyl-3-methyl-5-hydroxy-6-metoxy-1,4-benzoquinol methylase